MGEIAKETNRGLSTKPFKMDMAYELAEATTYEEWEAHGEMLFEMNQKAPFLLGDWALAGEGKFGEIAAQALDDRKIDYKTLANYKWVAHRVEFSRRREDLPFGHHETVAGLDPGMQDEMLDLAIKENWSRADLRKAVRALHRYEGETVNPHGEGESGDGMSDEEVKCPRCSGTGIVKASSIIDVTDDAEETE